MRLASVRKNMTFEINSPVYSPFFGKGKVTHVWKYDRYPVVVRFSKDGISRKFSLKGRYWFNDCAHPGCNCNEYPERDINLV